MGYKWITIAGVGALATASYAGPTGLNFMPIADMLGHREAYLAYSGSGTERKISTKVDQSHGLTVGLFDVMEVGYDNDFEGTTVYNLKIALANNDVWGLSIGLMSLRKEESESYVVARYNVSDRVRFHGGWLENGQSRGMFGLDVALNDNFTFMADTVSGRDSSTYVGFNAVFPSFPGFDITVSAGIPHERSTGYTWVVAVGYGTRF